MDLLNYNFGRKKMRVMVILAHPHPGRESFNHAIAQTAVKTLENNGHEVFFHDLYAEKFDPIIPYGEIPDDAQLVNDIERHCREISSADGIILVHPNWWGQPPAIMKGWVDRVIRPGVAYRFLEEDNGVGIPQGLLIAKAALVFNTCNTPGEWETKKFGDPLETIWKNCIFRFCGVKNFYRRMFGVIITSTLKEREEWLEEVKQTVRKYFPSGRV
jgi:NAD(P)H dehydrogenase (quinone)